MSAAMQSRRPTATEADAFLLRIHAQLPAIRGRATEVEQQSNVWSANPNAMASTWYDPRDIHVHSAFFEG